MSRIRTIKPDFWTDGNMIGLSPYARLFYIGSWNFTLCDRGHLADDAPGLRLKVLPGDTVDGGELLDELMGKGRIVRLSLPDGRTFLHIPRFEDHQKIDTRWNSRCPACTHQDSLNLTETHASLSETRGVSAPTGDSRLGGEGKGRERMGGGAPSRRCPEHENSRFAPRCGNCKEARLEHEQWVKDHPPETKSGIVTPPACSEHGYPFPCKYCNPMEAAS